MFALEVALELPVIPQKQTSLHALARILNSCIQRLETLALRPSEQDVDFPLPLLIDMFFCFCPECPSREKITEMPKICLQQVDTLV